MINILWRARNKKKPRLSLHDCDVTKKTGKQIENGIHIYLKKNI